MDSIERSYREYKMNYSRFQDSMKQIGKDFFYKLPHHTQMQIKLQVVRKQIENGK